MMSRAWLIEDLDGSDPSAVCACSVTRVPPCRSIPSFGVLEPGVKNTSPYSTTVIPTNVMIMRQGRNWLAGLAT